MENTKGSLVTSVIEGEPAAKAGIKTGDVITAVGGEKIDDSNQLLRRIAALRPGEAVKLDVLRKGSTQTVSVTLGQRDPKKLAQNGPDNGEEGDDTAGQAATVIGLSVREVSPQEAKALGMRVKRGGGNAGHNGLKSLTQELGTPDFTRLRLGIGRPLPGRDVAGYVLETFRPEEQPVVARVVPAAVDAVLSLFEDGLDALRQRLGTFDGAV